MYKFYHNYTRNNKFYDRLGFISLERRKVFFLSADFFFNLPKILWLLLPTGSDSMYLSVVMWQKQLTER